MHKNGIVHRDLKPNNLLVSKKGLLLKIADFNVAKFVEIFNHYNEFKNNNFEMNTYTGTIAFKAPEMFEDITYTESVDVWSAGCILFTMLCGY